MCPKKLVSFLLALLLLLSLSSCSSKSDESEAMLPANEVDEIATKTEESVVSDEVSFTALQSSDGFSWGGFGDDGLYYVNAAGRSDGSCNLSYADYQSAQSVYLCAQPNCTHDSETCSSYLIPTPGGIVAERVADRVILFFQNFPFYDPDNTSKARVESVALDGSDRKVIYEFSPNEMPQKPMLTDGKSVFFALWVVESEEKETANLVSLDINSGELSVVRNMDTTVNERIWGTDGQNIIIYRYTAPMSEPNWKCELVAWNPSTGHEKQVYSWGFGESYPLLQDGVLVIEAEDGFYHLLQVDSGENIKLSQYSLPEKGSGISTSVMTADRCHLIIRESSLSENGGVATFYYMLDTDGHKEQWDLLFDVDGDTEPYLIIAEIDGEKCLVYMGEGNFNETEISQDGTSNQLIASRKIYGIMKIKDYWNGNSELTIIK